MKKMLLIAFLIAALYSCKTSSSPKEVAKQFIEAVYAGDAPTASGLVTENTKASVSNLKAGETTGSEEQFSLTTLSETVNGNTAEVKNDLIKLSLQKEQEGWKVEASPELVASISNRRADLAVLKSNWEALLKEYEGRVEIAKEYVQYKNGQGTLSPQMQSLNDMINTLNAKTTWDKEKISIYVQGQKQLADMIDKSIEPSFTAGTDMGMNYILQLSNANDRIKAAQAAYNQSAKKTPSGNFPILPLP
ncbi:MAG: DUF4878 domain-containing protein [Chitinophagaceae bacterium]|nr:MAG: DUF4878 domain-containing protein [Chitinophagaceae bacterium]